MKEIIGQICVEIKGKGVCRSCGQTDNLAETGECLKCHKVSVAQALHSFGVEFQPTTSFNPPV